MRITNDELIQAAKDMNLAKAAPEQLDYQFKLDKFLTMFMEASLWQRVYCAIVVGRWRRKTST
jgi:hypothetical protein